MGVKMGVAIECHRGGNTLGEADEETSLLLRSILNTKKTVKGKFEPAPHSRVQGFFLSPCIRVHPASPGCDPCRYFPKLHRAFFADMQDGGWLHAWLTSSIKNVGELFTALQMFVVGSELYKSMDGREGRWRGFRRSD